VKTFIQKHPQDDCLEFLQMAGYMTGLNIEALVRRCDAMDRAQWMAKALYTLHNED